MSGAKTGGQNRFVASIRYIEDEIDRAKLRSTLMVHVLPRLSLGVEYNPLADDEVGPLANLLVVSETDRVPALMVGTSSDRIGTEFGQSYYATLSKDLEAFTQLPVAPYVGIAYGEFDDEFTAIGGMNLRFTERLSSLIIFDGKHVHPTLSWTQGRHVASVLLVEGERLGISYSIAFDLPLPRWSDRARTDRDVRDPTL